MERYINDIDISRFNTFLQGPSAAATFYTIGELPPVEEMFPDHVFRAVLFIKPEEGVVGHWVCLIKFSDSVFEYFDCLGDPAPEDVVRVLDEYSSLNGVPVELQQSSRPLMARTNFICGKWTMFRIMCLPKTIKEFHNFFTKLIGRRKITPDSIVNFIINIPRVSQE